MDLSASGLERQQSDWPARAREIVATQPKLITLGEKTSAANFLPPLLGSDGERDSSCRERHDPRNHYYFHVHLHVHVHLQYPSTSDPYEDQDKNQDQSRAKRASSSIMPATATASASAASAPSAPSVTPGRKTSAVPEKKYKCQFCNRAFSRSEHRSRHERSRKSLIYISFPSTRGWPAMAGSSRRKPLATPPTPIFPSFLQLPHSPFFRSLAPRNRPPR